MALLITMGSPGATVQVRMGSTAPCQIRMNYASPEHELESATSMPPYKSLMFCRYVGTN